MNTQELRKLAEAAAYAGYFSKHTGHYEGFCVRDSSGTLLYKGPTADNDLHAAWQLAVEANPQAILELLDKIDQLQAERDALAKAVQFAVDCYDYHASIGELASAYYEVFSMARQTLSDAAMKEQP